MTASLVSVLMTVRNGARYIGEALTSALDQTVPPGEVVVVDDGSVDGTADIVKRLSSRVTLLTQPPSGVAVGLNRAIAHASHDVICFLDSDDLWHRQAVERLLRRLAQTDGLDIAGGATQQFVSPELEPARRANLRFRKEPVHGALLGALMLRRQALQAVGPFDESLSLSSNVEWISRARRQGLSISYIPEVVLYRRIHGANLSLRYAEAQRRAMLEIVRRHHRGQSSGGPSAS